MFSPKRTSDYQGYRSGGAERNNSLGSMAVLIGAAMIAAAILLSTLVTALGGRYVAVEGPSDDTAWLVDRLSGTLYKCEAPARGKASCEPDIATGSIGAKPKP